MNCPDCAGAMWDNRADKRNPKSPDFKCKNAQCGKAVWEKPGSNGHAAPRPAPRPAVAAAVNGGGNGVNLGAHIPGLDDEPPHPADVYEEAPKVTRASLASVLALQETCFQHAMKLAGVAKLKGVAPTLEGISAMTAQAMIEASRRGL